MVEVNLILIWVGLKIVRVMLETWNVVHMQIQRTYLLLPKPSLFCWCQHSVCKKAAFFGKKIVPLLEATMWELCWRFFSSVFSFYRIKGYYQWKSITDHASWIRLPDCSKLSINQKSGNEATICWHDVIVNFFELAVFLLSSLVTSPSFMSI